MKKRRTGDFIDKRLSIFVSFAFVLVAVNRVATLPFASSFQNVIALGQWCIYFFLLLLCIIYIKRRSRTLFVSSYVCFFSLYLCSCIYSFLRSKPIDLIVSHEIVWTLLYFIPVGLATYSINNYKILFDCLCKSSYLISFLCLFYSIYRLYINPFGNSYDMAFGYILLLPTLVHWSVFKRTHNLVILIYIVIEIAFLLLFGSRGVVIGLVSFLILTSYLSNSLRTNKIKYIIPIFALVIFYVELPTINDYLEDQGIYSRTLMKLATGDEDDETHGRTNHWDTGMDLVKSNPILGYGLGGYFYDFHNAISIKHPEELYTFDPENGVWVKSVANVSGAHSGFIEMMLFFGVILGLPLALWILFSIIRIRKVDDPYMFNLTLIFYCGYIIGNMIVGGGIFTKPGCAIYLYLMYKIQKRTNYHSKVQKSF